MILLLTTALATSGQESVNSPNPTTTPEVSLNLGSQHTTAHGLPSNFTFVALQPDVERFESSSFDLGAATTGDLRAELRVSEISSGVSQIFRLIASIPSERSIAREIVHRAAMPAIADDVSLNVVDTPLSSVLNLLSVDTGTNLILLEASEHSLTLNLHNLTLDQMINHICAITGLRYLNITGTYVVASEERLSNGYPTEWADAYPTEVEAPLIPEAEPTLVRRTLELHYVTAESMATSLKGLYPESVLKATSAPVPISLKLNDRDTASITGVESGMLESNESQSRTLILVGPPDVIAEAMQLAERLDIKPPQIDIKVEILDVNEEALREAGFSWTIGNVQITEGSGLGSFTRAPQTFVATVKALEQQDRAKLLASPNVSVLDGHSAYVLIGDRINFPVVTGYSDAGTPIISTKEERVGIYLQVRASVTGDDEVTLALYPQVSTIVGFLEAAGSSYPQISTREAQTILRVGSNETVVMAGLLKTEELTQLEEVPFLADIPIIGELFTRRKRVKQLSQVIITITPRIIQEEE